jgi:hypothetical protein
MTFDPARFSDSLARQMPDAVICTVIPVSTDVER